ncbi:hypothetical protein AB0D04_37040 [Streptomyces sp. NPDC048483]|uniref:hypothetical protein n=1 Tax=Streptomyces sp. NPDC048483 TaxID=3154927 RepID=UPI00343ECC2B
MSGSPKYAVVALAPLLIQRESAARRRQNAARIQRERERAEERRRLAEERARRMAARREQSRAEIQRRQAELAQKRQEQQAARSAVVERERGAAAGRRLNEVVGLIARTREEVGPSPQLDDVEAELGRLRQRLGRDAAGAVEASVEELRGRVVALRPSAAAGGAGRTDHQEVLGALAERLAAVGPEGAALDEAGQRRCTELLERLRSAVAEGQGVRFEALLGTAEQAIDRHVATVRQSTAEAEERDRRAAEERDRRVAEEQQAAELAAQQEAEAAERERAHADALAEVTGRLSVVRDAVHDAVRDAADFEETELGARLSAALRAVEDALAAGYEGVADAAMSELERLLPEAEARLDEALLAYERRGALARAVQEAMSGEGLAFTGGQDQGARLILHFERPNGALYETTLSSDDHGDPMLVYTIDGEPDVSALAPEGSAAVCDRTEDLLERVHEAMGDDGFLPGQLTWEGKPPRERGNPLPSRDVRRTR